MNRRILVLLILVLLLTQLGCSYEDIENEVVVAGLAIDYVDNESGDSHYLVTAEILIPGSEGGSNSITTKLVSDKAPTLMAAIGNLITKSSRKLYFGHCAAVVISEKAAVKGIIPVIELIFRNYEIQFVMGIIIARGCSAYELFSTEHISVNIKAYELFNTVRENQKKLGIAPSTLAYHFINDINDIAKTAKTPYFTIVRNFEGKPEAVLSGIAIFDGDKLKGYLSPETSPLAMLASNTFKSGEVSVALPSINKTLTLDIVKSGTEYSVKEDGISAEVTVKINMTVILNEITERIDLSYAEDIPSVKSELEYVISESVKETVRDTLKRYGTDIFGLSVQIQRQRPDFWLENKDNWDQIIGTMRIKTECSLKIQSSGLSDKDIIGGGGD